MKVKYKFGLGLAFSLLALAACSSDSLSSAESVGENWPSDFTVAEYSRVNPDLANFQRMEAVAKANAAYLATLGDTSKTISFEDSTELAVFFDDSNSVKTFFVEYAGISAEYWPGMEALRGGMMDADGNLLDIDVTQAAMEYRSIFGRFHRYGNTATQDIAYLQSIAIDSVAIEYQYVKVGKYEGRAYRFCKEGEAVVKQFTETRDVRTVPDTTVEYVYKDTVYMDTTHLDSPDNYIIQKEGSTEPDTVSAKSKAMMDEDGEKYEVLDSIMVIVKEKTERMVVDSTVTIELYRVTTTTKAPSKETNAADANEGSPLEGRVWNFSADYFCKNAADGVTYLIVNP